MGFSNRQAALPKKALTHEHKQSIQQLINMSIFLPPASEQQRA